MVLARTASSVQVRHRHAHVARDHAADVFAAGKHIVVMLPVLESLASFCLAQPAGLGQIEI